MEGRGREMVVVGAEDEESRQMRVRGLTLLCQ